MATSQPTMRSLYRSFLRELPPRAASAKSRSPLQQHLRQSFSPDKAGSPEHSPAQADQLLQYLRAQRQYIDLIERYNPGMNMDDEERVRLSARRIGMNMPLKYTQEDGKGSK